MLTNNPWRGLASYKDPLQYQNSCIKYEFCGRDTDISSLVKLIDNNLFVTLYGRTGIGKTSLLNAGVFPALRQHGYWPIYVRLLHEATERSYAEAIVDKVKKSGLKEYQNVPSTVFDWDSDEVLWNYFCTTIFQNKEGQDVYPVIVLDQFEEIFFTDKGKAEKLLRQIYMLLSDELVMPVDSGYSDETNYRFVASIREDNLFLLEDSIDNLSLNVYKSNRFRLRPFSTEHAREAILGPGSNCICPEEQEQIVDRIIKISTEKDGSLSSLILSLLCSLMYEKAKANNGNVVKLQQIPKSADDTDKILLEFYLKNTSKRQRRFIERELLTEDGHRRASEMPVSEVDDLLAEECRILKRVETEEGKKIELVHDRMAKVIYKYKRKKDTNRFRNLLRIVLFIVLCITGWFSIILSWSSIKFHSPYTLFTKGITAINSISINKDGTKCEIEEDSKIERIYIGENVKEVDSLILNKEGVEILLSENNKYFVWDTLWYENKGCVGYLHYKNKPDSALYIQYNIKSSQVRLPQNIKYIKYGNRKFYTSNKLPAYGEKVVTLSNYNMKFRGDKKIEEVYVKIKEIPQNCFQDCSNLKKIHFDEVTEIEPYAFKNCFSLKEVDMSESESITFGNNAFDGCVRLQSVKLPQIVKGNVDNLFYSCYSLNSISLSNEMDVIATDGISNMFSLCPHLTKIDIPSPSPFIMKSDGVCYYISPNDTIPLILSNVKQNEWSQQDSLFYCEKGIIQKQDPSNKNSYLTINFVPSQMNEKWHKEFGYKFTTRHYKNKDICFVVSTREDSVLFLPQHNISTVSPIYNDDGTLQAIDNKEYECYGIFDNLVEIHLPIADPNIASLFFYPDINKRKVVLYVPFGSKEAYELSGKFSDYKEIREETKTKRVLESLDHFVAGITYNFNKYALLFYPLLLIGLGVLFVFYYWLRIRQMKINGTINYKKAIWDGIKAVMVSFVGFIPVYWLSFIYFTNYCPYTNDYELNMLFSSILGISSVLLCSYLYIYSGKGNIRKSFKLQF